MDQVPHSNSLLFFTQSARIFLEKHWMGAESLLVLVMV